MFRFLFFTLCEKYNKYLMPILSFFKKNMCCKDSNYANNT
jgi:hypothetical protein